MSLFETLLVISALLSGAVFFTVLMCVSIAAFSRLKAQLGELREELWGVKNDSRDSAEKIDTTRETLRRLYDLQGDSLSRTITALQALCGDDAELDLKLRDMRSALEKVRDKRACM